MTARARGGARVRGTQIPRIVRARRGVMLFAVIVVLAVAALAVGALSVAQEAEYAGQVATQDQSQQRAVAWSGAQAVAAVLGSQRDAIAAGDQPDLPPEMTLWEADGTTAVVRLLPVGMTGELAVSESAKRSLSTLTADQLALAGVVSAEAAAAAVARKDSCDAIEGLVDPEHGLSPSVVLGPVVTAIADGVRAAQEGRDSSKEGAARPPALIDVVTPFEAQRALRIGAAGTTEPRIVLKSEWTDEMLQALDAATTAGTAAKVRDALQNKIPADESELVRAMAAAKLEPAAWGAVLNAVICAPDAIEVARVDITRAPEPVLRTLPGITVEHAARWVQERQSLDAAEQQNASWLVTKNVLTAEEFAAVAPHITAASWLWRVRVVTGVLDQASESDALQGVQVWDVVIDLAENPPRFASLRDCTLLPVASALATMPDAEGPEEPKNSRAERDAEDSKLAPQIATEPVVTGKDQTDPPPAEQAPKEAPAKSDSWDRLADTMRNERAERQRSEEARRAGNRARTISGTGGAARGNAGSGARGGTPAPAADAPRSDSISASDAPSSGRSAGDAPAANTPAGGLSGRWRARGTRP